MGNSRIGRRLQRAAPVDQIVGKPSSHALPGSTRPAHPRACLRADYETGGILSEMASRPVAPLVASVVAIRGRRRIESWCCDRPNRESAPRRRNQTQRQGGIWLHSHLEASCAMRDQHRGAVRAGRRPALHSSTRSLSWAPIRAFRRWHPGFQSLTGQCGPTLQTHGSLQSSFCKYLQNCCSDSTSPGRGLALGCEEFTWPEEHGGHLRLIRTRHVPAAVRAFLGPYRPLGAWLTA